MEKTKTENKTNITLNESKDNKEPTVDNKDKITNLKPIKLALNIPSNPLERINYVNNLFYNDELNYKNSNVPERNNAPISEIGKYFQSEYNTYDEILAGILYYFSQELKIDREMFDTSKPLNQDANKVYKSGKGASEGICNLFIEICKSIRIKCELVTGLVKRKGYKQGDSLRRHYWIGIKSSGKYYYIDPTLFMGELIDNNESSKPEKQFHPYYCFTPNDLLADSHRPDSDQFKLQDKEIPLKSFVLKSLIDYESFYYNVFVHKIQLISHLYPQFICRDSEVNIILNVNNANLYGKVELKGKRVIIEELKNTLKKNESSTENYNIKTEKTKEENEFEKEYDKLKFDYEKKSFLYHIKLPSDGIYNIILYSKAIVPSNEAIKEILNYKMNAKIINIIKPPLKKVLNIKIRQTSVGSKNLSIKEDKSERRKLTKSASAFKKKKKMKCYDNKNAYLYEPKSEFLKVGQDVKFNVKIRNAKNVFVIDGNRWNYLKRKEDDTFEGVVNIKSSNVSICKLKSGGVYTEVFEFFAIKRDNNIPK